MKKLTLSFITLTVLIAIFTTASSQVVLDISGHPVQSNAQYYILPAKIGSGGGLIPSNRNSNTKDLCLNLDIIQSSSPFVSGLPVTFSQHNTKTKLIQLSTSLNLEFDSTVWFCHESKIWKIDHSVELRKSFVSTGGEKGKGNSLFQIQEDGDDAYKILYCPISSTVSCINVGLEIDDRGVRRLVLAADRSFAVKFQKAYDSNSNCHLKSSSKMFPFL